MKKVKKKKYFAIILVLIIVALILLIDVFSGFLYQNIAPEFGKKNLELALNEYNGDSCQLSVQPHPYLTYINTPLYCKNGYRQHNSMGYRNAENTTFSKDSACFRVLVMGGSTTYGDGVDNPGKAWPHILQKILNDSIGLINDDCTVEVINAGMPWATSAELLNHYIQKNRYLDANVVILHTGGNDIQPRAFDDYKSDYTHWRSIQCGGKNGLKPGEGWLVKHSNICKLLYSLWYNNMDYAASRPYIHTKEYNKLTTDEIHENVNNSTNESFCNHLRLLLRNIQNDGSVPVYFQFYAAENTLKENRHIQKKQKKTQEQNQVLGIAAYENRDSAFSICRNNGVVFLEMPPGFVPAEHMVDVCHMNQQGQRKKAEFVAKEIMPLLESWAH